jgi:predicted metal-dependent enzyme (double-stranded beta helix superfamily)
MFDKDRFVEACLAALKDSLPQRAVQELVSEAVSAPGNVESALGTPTSAGINTLYRSDQLTVLNVIWAPHMTLYPHDHRTWAVIGIYGGQEDNAFYRRRKEGIGLEQVNGRSLRQEDIIGLGPEAIHAVTNPLRQFTGAIHVYGGDFFAINRSEWDTPESAEQPYSVEHAMQTFADANERAKSILAAPEANASP